MIKNIHYRAKCNKRISQCDEKIAQGENVEFWTEQKANWEKALADERYKRRIVMTWERSHGKWFDGTTSDVMSFEDIVDFCNESQFDEQPIELINTLFIAVGGTLDVANLNDYLYLPASMVSEDENIATIRDSFKNWRVE